MYINQLSFCFFSLRETPCFSTKIVSKLYEKRVFSLRVSLRLFPIFYIPFFSPCLFFPVLSKSLPFHLEFLFFSLSFFILLRFFSFSRAFICALIYYNVPPFSPSFPSFRFYVLQHLCLSAYYEKVSFLFENNSWYILLIL